MDLDCDEEDYTSYLERWSYRSLQKMAKAMSLPSNVKKIYLIQLIYTKKFKSPAELANLAKDIRLQRKHVTGCRRYPIKTPKKRNAQQSIEVSSTSNSKSPPISHTPKRSSHAVVRYSPELQPKYSKSVTNSEIINKTINAAMMKSDRVLRSYKAAKRPFYLVNDSDEAKETRLHTVTSDNCRKFEVGSHVSKCVDQWQRADLVPATRSVHTSPPPSKRQRTVSGIYPLNKEDIKMPNVFLRRPDGTLSKINAIIQKPVIQLDRNLQNQIRNQSVPMPNISGISDILNINEATYKENKYTEYYHKKIRADQIRQKGLVFRGNDQVYNSGDEQMYKRIGDCTIYRNQANHQLYRRDSHRNIGYSQVHKTNAGTRMYKSILNTPVCDSTTHSQVYSNGNVNVMNKNIVHNQLYKSRNNNQVYKSIQGKEVQRNDAENQNFNTGNSLVFRSRNNNQNVGVNKEYKSVGNNHLYKTVIDNQIYKTMGDKQDKNGNEIQMSKSVTDNQLMINDVNEKIRRSVETFNRAHKIGDSKQIYDQVTKKRDELEIYKTVGENEVHKSTGENQTYKTAIGDQLYINNGNQIHKTVNRDESQVNKHVGEYRVYKSRNLMNKKDDQINNIVDIQVYNNIDAQNVPGNQISKSEANRLSKTGGDKQEYIEENDSQISNHQNHQQICQDVGDEVYKDESDNQLCEIVENKQVVENENEKQVNKTINDELLCQNGKEQLYKKVHNIQMYKTLEDTQVSERTSTQIYKSLGETYKNGDNRQTYNSFGGYQMYTSQNDNQLYSGQIYRYLGENQVNNNGYNLLYQTGNNHIYTSGDFNQAYGINDECISYSHERLPRIGEVFSQCKTMYRNVTQPIYVRVADDAEMTQSPVETPKQCMLEQLYNLKSSYLTQPPLLQVCTTNTRCVYSTPIMTTAKAQPALTAVADDFRMALASRESEYGTNMEMIRREDFFSTYSYSDDAVSLCSQGANVTIPEMVEDALELISQDGDYLERLGMDARARCLLRACRWAGPRIMLDYHTRREHPSDIVYQETNEWISSFSLGALSSSRGWLSAVSGAGGRLYAVCATYRQPDCFMAIISNLSETDTPRLARLTIYNKVTGEPYTWQGEILPLSDTMPYESSITCLTLELSKMDLLPNSANLKLVNGELVPKSPNNVVVGQPELDSIHIIVNVQLLN